MNWRPMLEGLKTFLPGRHYAMETGGTNSARYCYSVWLRHLAMAHQNGLNADPGVVAELGPGDSLGIGLAALISGAEKYVALDVVKFADLNRNMVIFDEMVSLFKEKAPIPGNDEFPGVWPRLESYAFPSELLESRLKRVLGNARLEKIRQSILSVSRRDSMVEYRVPWFGPSVIEKESVDLIFSQAVLEHVDDLADAYRAMYQWLKPNGIMSHTIDFRCHGTADQWNGHRTYSDFMWKIIRGRRPYLLNREPHSSHLDWMHRSGFDVMCDKTATEESNFRMEQMAPQFRSTHQADLSVSGAYVLAVKKWQLAEDKNKRS